MYVWIRKYVDVRINFLKNLYTILKNTYIQFEEYGIKYVYTQYRQFEKYDMSTRMNDGGWTSVDGRKWTDIYGWTSMDGRR
jgi:hypothetical protein